MRKWFDSIPTPVKIIFYSGLSLGVAALIADVNTLEGWYATYIVIGAGIATNLIAWRLLKLKGSK